MNWVNRASIVSALAGILCAGTSALAQPNQGFELNRYQPTAAGEWSFAVDHPWYSSTRRFAAGITLNYGHNPLVAGSQDASGAFSESQSLINHLFIAHVDLAGSFLDRGQIPTLGGTRYYTAYYRNNLNYCTPSTFNFSNGLQLVWTP